MLDNLKAHKSPRVAEILARKNCTVRHLPPYSPDFNPIEMAISKLKSALRKLAERTFAGLLAILEGCADLFKAAECGNYFEACRVRFRRNQTPRHNLIGFRCERPPPKGGGFGLRLKAGLGRPQGQLANSLDDFEVVVGNLGLLILNILLPHLVRNVAARGNPIAPTPEMLTPMPVCEATDIPTSSLWELSAFEILHRPRH